MYPILFKIGPLTIHTYGVLLALAFLAAIYVAAREGVRLGLPAERFLDLGFYIILAALAGSRLLFVILEPRTFLSQPLQIFAIWKGGLDFQGGLFLGLLVAFLFIHYHKLPWRCPWGSLSGGSAASWPGAASAYPPRCPGP